MSTATPQHAATSRSREAPQGDEEASSELRLGEFQNVDALTHSEAALVINALVAKRRVDRKNVNETERKENVEAVERLLTAHKELAKFERAQLGSLCCDSAEEAKTLIPSLTDKITDDDLQELLDEITKLMGYGS
ncbi:DNA-directed RNA polymerase II subunit rpb4 [Lachnellula suecica]|uniref:DNA-directed RNA polymerase II subunit rpb4 n=1 Tax=Lachnellula suecica TaxID=602035 RepID=A0A8T9BS72_9HELO|nr:DNA-directed RNA polymerase II subunit rpb4 [Lachnellula suecica]